ncbi:Protein MAIN-LIKE 1 [Glycine max]|uniref:protein MAIN-LIKE 1-like n=1 Tax=Glycine max TaxID=3847 RepID=UPI001B357E71|nr:protein MAIN-LIKE 1-like [Glycine max]KAH1262403.1 Protein MAIN-LIKE 1 [Glycine max]
MILLAVAFRRTVRFFGFLAFRRSAEIMVRTRGLGRVLGHVTSRGVGRRNRDDFDDAPQRRRPTASARRQRVAVTTEHDEPVVPVTEAVGASVGAAVYAYELMAGGDVNDTRADTPVDTGAQATEDEPEWFPGGPSDPSVLTEYADHVAGSVWMGELSSHGRKVHSLGRPVPTIEGLVVGTGLSPLIACSVNTGDRGLLSLFVERWHRETSSFHLPVGEVKITLDDVSSLLHLPVVGDLHAFQPLHVDDVVKMLVDLLTVSAEAVRAETGQCHGSYIRLQWVRDIYERRCQAGHWTTAAHAYLLHLLGCTMFANKNAINVHVVFLEALCDLSQTGRYTWGVAALVHMYDHLNDASISSSRQFGGYITLLQCWIYEHFPSVAESIVDSDYDEDSSRAYRWIATKKTVKNIRTPMYRERLDRLRIPDVCWIPYREHQPVRDSHMISCYSGLLRWGPVVVYYRPERVMRNFGYTQTILAPPVDSWVSYDDIHDMWMHYSDHMVAAGEVCTVSGQCASDYIDWFFHISHPFMTPGQASDPPPDGHALPPRVVPQVPETDIPHVSEPGEPLTSVRPVVDEPRHAVEVCYGIAERLERHLSLGVVMPSSSTYEVIEECLRMAKSVTQDQLVYVRSRCRRCTDQT